MLPLYGLAVVAEKQGDAASLLVLLISFLALPLRGLIAAYFISR